MIIAIVCWIATIYYTIKYFKTRAAVKNFAQVMGQITEKVADGKHQYLVRVKYTVPDGREFTTSYTQGVKEITKNEDTCLVYYSKEQPSVSISENALNKHKKVALTMAVITVFYTVVSVGMFYDQYMPKNSHITMEYEVTMKELPEKLTDYDLKQAISRGQSLMIISKKKEKPYYKLETDDPTQLKANGYDITVTHVWGDRRRESLGEITNVYDEIGLYNAVAASKDKEGTYIVCLIKVTGAYGLLNINELITEAYSDEKMAQYIQDSLPEEVKTVMDIPKELENVGAKQAEFSSDKYIFHQNSQGEVNEIAIIPVIKMTENESIHQIKWNPTWLTYAMSNDDKYYDMEYFYIENYEDIPYFHKPKPENITPNQPYIFLADEEGGESVLWVQRENGYFFVIKNHYVETEEEMTQLYEQVEFKKDHYSEIQAPGPQALRKIVHENADGIMDREYWHTVGLDCQWADDSFSELGIQDGVQVKMEFGKIGGLGNEVKLNRLFDELVTDITSLTGTFGEKSISACYAAGIDMSSKELTWKCRSYWSDKEGDKAVITTISIPAKTEIEKEEIEQLMDKIWK